MRGASQQAGKSWGSRWETWHETRHQQHRRRRHHAAADRFPATTSHPQHVSLTCHVARPPGPLAACRPWPVGEAAAAAPPAVDNGTASAAGLSILRPVLPA